MEVSMTKPTAERLELAIKTVGVIAVVLSGLWGIYSYRQSMENEARRPVWARQLALYFEITEAAGKIVSLRDGDPKKQEAFETYWTLFHGPLVVVQDHRTVAEAKIRFGRCITKPGASHPVDKCDPDELSNRAIALALACKESIGQSWDRKFESLTHP
jgi:hypothetical protein